MLPVVVRLTRMRLVGLLLIIFSVRGGLVVEALPAQTEITDEQLHAIHNVTDIPAE